MRPSMSDALRALAADRARAAIITDVWGDNVKVEKRGDAIEVTTSDGSLVSCINLDPRNARALIAEVTRILGEA